MRGFHSRIGVISFFNTRLFMIDRLFISFLLVCAVPAFAAPSYEHDITPLLRTYCAGCHNDRDAEGGLSVETFASFRRGGEFSGDPISPGSISSRRPLIRSRWNWWGDVLIFNFVHHVSTPNSSRQHELASLFFTSKSTSNIHCVARRTCLTALSFGSLREAIMRIRS
ncbi:MAG: hypothetical protein EBZ13_05435 [Planctomycetia bacterium]|nr:hypothetical protein [Planctomycetia bacterium]